MSSHSDSELGSGRIIKLSAKARKRRALIKSLASKFRTQNCTRQEKHLLQLVNVNNTEGAQRLLENGVNANCRDRWNRSPLHIAASGSYTELVRMLLEYGANPNCQDISLNTPLHLAACNNNLPLIKLLIDGGADLRPLNKNGCNPIQIAESKLRILQQLLQRGFVETGQIKGQFQEIVDIMISMWCNREKTNWGHHRENVLDLEMIKFSLKSTEEKQVDDQIGKVLIELEQFSLK